MRVKPGGKKGLFCYVWVAQSTFIVHVRIRIFRIFFIRGDVYSGTEKALPNVLRITRKRVVVDE